MFNNLLFCVTNKQKIFLGGLKNNFFFNFSLLQVWTQAYISDRIVK